MTLKLFPSLVGSMICPVVSGAYDYTVKVWDPESESCTHTLQGHTNRVYSLQVTPWSPCPSC
uniref:Uncharacterized protein n=1 Tax=Amazona collaria TaxID=241587 RepID=A0A8B9FI35_9PSIT